MSEAKAFIEQLAGFGHQGKQRSSCRRKCRCRWKRRHQAVEPIETILEAGDLDGPDLQERDVLIEPLLLRQPRTRQRVPLPTQLRDLGLVICCPYRGEALVLVHARESCAKSVRRGDVLRRRRRVPGVELLQLGSLCSEQRT